MLSQRSATPATRSFHMRCRWNAASAAIACSVKQDILPQLISILQSE